MNDSQLDLPSPNDAEVARRALPLVDLTELGDGADAADVDRLCARAIGRFGAVAAVCIWPRAVPQAAITLAGTGVRIATVVNFPSGDEALDDVVAQTVVAIDAGADEIDLVIPYHALQIGDTSAAMAMIDAVRAVVPMSGAHHLKVILETGELSGAAAIAEAATLALNHGADFLKTSTGKTPVSATLDATAVMLDVIRVSGRDDVGLKPSGGIRTVADARAYLQQADDVMGAAWATAHTFRFGASSLLDALERTLHDTED